MNKKFWSVVEWRTPKGQIFNLPYTVAYIKAKTEEKAAKKWAKKCFPDHPKDERPVPEKDRTGNWRFHDETDNFVGFPFMLFEQEVIQYE